MRTDASPQRINDQKRRDLMPLPGNWTFEDILTLSFFRKINTAKLRAIVKRFNSLADALDYDGSDVLVSEFKQTQIFVDSVAVARDRAREQIEISAKHGSRIITYWDEDYPILLKEITFPPAILYVRGEIQSSDSVCISIVGTRKCTMQYGKIAAESFSKFFARNGAVVVSGMARGIDTIAHKAALKAGGATYAVLAHGLDQISSKFARQVADKIVESGGALIGEYPWGVKAQLGYFLHRNRIISGISKASIIIESAERGGSMNTARNAFDQSREVFALPGPITSPVSRGTNLLIKRNQAQPALSPEEVYEELGFKTEEPIPAMQDKDYDFNDSERKIYDSLGSEPRHADDIAIATGVDISEMMSCLLNLEFMNAVKKLPGNYYVKSI